RWTAPSAGLVTIDTTGSDFDTLLAAYTGSSIVTLTAVAAADDVSSTIRQSSISFPASSGTTYRIAVDGHDGAAGSVKLNLSQSAPPSAAPQTLTGSTVSGAGSTVTATKEAGEPSHAGDAGGRSIWYRWTAPSGGSVSLDTTGSDFDTLLAVYTGSSVGALTQVAANDDANGSTKASATTFDVKSGTTYAVAVDGWSGAAGNVKLNLVLTRPPGNDAFAAAQVIAGAAGSIAGTNLAASKEAGEPNHAGNVGGHSVWYRWTAPASTTLTIDTVGSSFDTLLAVYKGSSVGSLTAVASNDDIVDQQQPQSRVSFAVTAGTTYQIAVDGWRGTGTGAVGSVMLNWSSSAPPPPNDAFASAQSFSGTTGNLGGTNVGATKETSEPNHAGNAGGHSVWYRWTAPATGTATLDLEGSSFDTLLAVYTGSGVTSLTSIASNDDSSASDNRSRVSFSAISGTTYRVAVD